MRNRLIWGFVPALVLAMLPVASFAGVSIGVSINIAPPPLPVYVQPVAPGPDYIWTPGYWAWDPDDADYYWVPGTWVLAPEPGFLWTPGYWGWVGGAYIWHAGYWGPHVGFYGGVNYGFGYTGSGFEGCYWRGGHVVYNRAVTNVTNINVTNVYNKTVVVNNVSHVSFNGGAGGLSARATAAQLAAEHDRHMELTATQREHVNLAEHNRDLRASVNGGRPQIAATMRPTSFTGKGVVAARAAGGPVHLGAPAHVASGPGRVGSGRVGPGRAGPERAGPEHTGPEHGGAGPHVGDRPQNFGGHPEGGAHEVTRADRPPHATGQPNMHPNGSVEPHMNGSAQAHGSAQPPHLNGSAEPRTNTARTDRPPQAEHRAPSPQIEHHAPAPQGPGSGPQMERHGPVPQNHGSGPQIERHSPAPQARNPSQVEHHSPAPQAHNPAPQMEHRAPAPQMERHAPAPQPERHAQAPEHQGGGQHQGGGGRPEGHGPHEGQQRR